MLLLTLLSIKSMRDIRQYLSGADKAVQIRRAVFVDDGTQSEFRHNKSEIALLIRISDILYAWLFWVQTF